MPSNYRELTVWQKGIELAKRIYQITQTMPDTEKYGLTSQVRRAVVSVSSNIAEGNARPSRRDYVHFLIIARGSLAEIETQLTIAEELKMIPRDDYVWNLIGEVTRMLQALINRLSRPA
jgi:four helix bundle protein